MCGSRRPSTLRLGPCRTRMCSRSGIANPSRRVAARRPADRASIRGVDRRWRRGSPATHSIQACVEPNAPTTNSLDTADRRPTVGALRVERLAHPGRRLTTARQAMGERDKGKVAIVTGAGSVEPGWGNGKAAAVLYAREGAKVLAVDLRPEAA